MGMVYPAIKPTLLSGMERITDSVSVNDYWRWAHSTLVDNAERGAFAEFLVKIAVGDKAETRINWDLYDILSPEGIKIEVKAAGYIQSWRQERLSTISFSIRPTYGWNAATNTYDTEKKRQSDMYVFALHKHMEQNTINVADVNQWTFFVMLTKILNEEVGEQNNIGLVSLKKLGAVETDFAGLRNTILENYGKALIGGSREDVHGN